MPTFIVSQAATVVCPHLAPAALVCTGVRVLVSGQPVMLLSDMGAVAGCPLSASLPPTPCVTVSWVSGSTRVTVGGQPVVLQESVGLAKNPAQAPQGPPQILMTQLRVTAS